MSVPFSFVLNVVAAGNDLAEFAPEIRARAATVSAVGGIEWLASFHALDISFVSHPERMLHDVRRSFQSHPFDINVVPAESRRKSLLIADMDSTIITCECLDELADMAGIKPRIAAITDRAMRGEIEFATALRERVKLLEGLDVRMLERAYRERVKLQPGAKQLVATMKAHGARTVLVSGGFTYFTSRVARDAGFDEDQANVLLDDGRSLTGFVKEPVLGREAKLEALARAADDLQIPADQVLAVGDGANDLDMIKRAGLGVAFHAKPIVAQAAAARVDHGDLTALLYLQGYREKELAIGGI
jgi:phosphoserine phosphatase